VKIRGRCGKVKNGLGVCAGETTGVGECAGCVCGWAVWFVRDSCGLFKFLIP
jgi:hypothetical protein